MTFVITFFNNFWEGAAISIILITVKGFLCFSLRCVSKRWLGRWSEAIWIIRWQNPWLPGGFSSWLSLRLTVCPTSRVSSPGAASKHLHTWASSQLPRNRDRRTRGWVCVVVCKKYIFLLSRLSQLKLNELWFNVTLIISIAEDNWLWLEKVVIFLQTPRISPLVSFGPCLPQRQSRAHWPKKDWWTKRFWCTLVLILDVLASSYVGSF